MPRAVIRFILLGDGAHHFAGGTVRHHIGRNVLGHKAAGADDGVISNGDAGEHNGICPYQSDVTLGPNMV